MEGFGPCSAGARLPRFLICHDQKTALHIFLKKREFKLILYKSISWAINIFLASKMHYEIMCFSFHLEMGFLVVISPR